MAYDRYDSYHQSNDMNARRHARQPEARGSRGRTTGGARYSDQRQQASYATTSRTTGDGHYRSSGASRRGAGNGYVASNRSRQGYQAPTSNPYALKAANSQFGHVNGEGYVKEGYGKSRGHAAPQRGGGRGKTLLILVVVLAILGGAGIFFWTHRPVEITVNDTRATYTFGTTLASIKDDKGISTKAGNLLSVSGKVLKEGGGTPYSVSINGNALADDRASDYQISGGEDISIGDGTDKTEDYTSAVVETQPKLTMDGSYGAISYVSQWGKSGKQEVRTGKVSGETVNGDTVQQGQDCVIKLVNIKPQNDQKIVAITFDDGPSSYTSKYLDILKQHGAVATFFNLGSAVDASPSESKAIVDAGCQLASHTYSHDDLPTDTGDKVLSEVTSAFTSIKNATGLSTTVIRPPYGDFKQKTWLETKGSMSVSVLWNMDSRDWALPGADKIVSNATSGIQSGYIILMHDGGGNRDEDLQALPTIIDNLHSQGYTFVTINDLLKSQGDIPDDICSGNATMPSDAVWPTEIG